MIRTGSAALRLPARSHSPDFPDRCKRRSPAPPGQSARPSPVSAKRGAAPRVSARAHARWRPREAAGRLSPVQLARAESMGLPKGRLPASFGENGHCFATREMPGPDQNALCGNLQRGIDRSGHLSGVHVPGVRHHAAASRYLFFSIGAEFFDLAGELSRVSRIKASGDRRGANHRDILAHGFEFRHPFD